MPVTSPGGTYPLAGRPVARVGYGAMQLERLASSGSAADRKRAVEVLRRAVAEGVNHIDTASFYGDAVVDALIHDALHPYPDGLVVVSKVGAAHSPDGLVAAQRPDELRAGVEADLRALEVERVDVVNLRRLDHRPGILAEGDQVVDLDDQLATLHALRDEGKIGAIGLSQVTAEQLRQALPVGIACVQNRDSLVDRADEQLLAQCADNGVAWVPFFPLGGAFPGRPKVVEQPVVISAAAELDATPAQIGLAWLLARSPNVLLIPGTADLDHLAANLAAGDIDLPPQTLAALDELVPVGPGQVAI